jgi:hypothetical protein
LSVFGGVGGASAGAYGLHITGLYQISLTIIVVVCVIGAIGTVILNTPKIYVSNTNKTKINI